jgi:hypothetical protein
MSANAGTWFYREPEHQPFMITERLNGTFWQARLVEIYWRCVKADGPFKAEGYLGDQQLDIEWLPAQWLMLRVPAGLDSKTLVKTFNRVLARKAVLTYDDSHGSQIFEWHMDGGKARWKEIQGKAGFVKPRLLTS